MILTFFAFLTTMLLLGLIVVVPLMIIAFVKKDKKIIFRRFKASCWFLGVLILILFPAFWLIPQQVYVRVNRQTTLITPNIAIVNDFADEFLADPLAAGFAGMNFTQKSNAVGYFTEREISWKMDYETYGMAGHVATPTECITRREDDCQGQAVTMASLLLNPKINFTYVWVVETPWHWYVLVRDPAKGPLPIGWEKNVELYQENGEVVPLNRDGGGGTPTGKKGGMPEYRWEPIQLIFNDKETLYPVNFFEAIWIGWTGTGFFQHEIFSNFIEEYLLFILIGSFILAVPFVGWTNYMTNRDGDRDERKKYRNLKVILPKILLIGTLIFSIFIAWWASWGSPWILWDFTLIIAISELSIISSLASEHKFWKLIRIEK
jgi:hypothetical protein